MARMDAPEDPPPWGQLIDTERDRLRPAISQNEAAKRAGISGTRWRQIVDGRAGAMDSDRGTQTLARMAEVAGVRPAQLEETGRRDVADELRRLTPSHPPMDAAEAGMDENERLAAELVENFRHAGGVERQALLALSRAARRAAENPGPQGDPASR